MTAHSALLFFGSMPAACYASTHNRHLPPHTGGHAGECLFTFVHIPLPLRGREEAKSETTESLERCWGVSLVRSTGLYFRLRGIRKR